MTKDKVTLLFPVQNYFHCVVYLIIDTKIVFFIVVLLFVNTLYDYCEMLFS